MIQFLLNGQSVAVDLPGDTPLLWVIREYLQLTGSRFGCGKGLCGACTVHFNGSPVRSCILPLASVAGAEVTTIEGLSQGNELHPVQQAWLEQDVPQCGYCQSGQIMSAVALLEQHPSPTEQQIDAFMSGNLCRCGTYPRIRKAIHQASSMLKASGVQQFTPSAAIENEAAQP